MRSTRVLRARWVFPVDQPPLRDGVVELRGDEIVAVRPYQAGDAVEDLGDVAILPGLVNAHTHLEFSRLAQPLGAPQTGFSDWIQGVIDYRQREQNAADPVLARAEAVAMGLTESQAAGVALLGEIATANWPAPLFHASPLQTVVFAELLGLASDRQEALWQLGREHVEQGEMVECRWLPGLSPHAPYTVHPELLARVCEFSAENHFPVAMHLAESLEEIELLLSGGGRMVEFLDRLRAFPRGVIARGTRPQDYLEQLARADRALVIHGNYLADDEIEFLGQRSERMSAVYCPRTHAYFNAGDYPLAKMLAANVQVCLGTDSRASNPDLNLFEEMRFVARRHPLVTPEGVLYLGTQAGAEALGQGDRFGTLSPGKSSRITVVKLSGDDARDPHKLLFAEGTSATGV